MEKWKRSEALDWIVHLAVAVALAVFIVVFIAQRTIVHDISMEPTLVEGDNLLVEKISPRFGWLKRGDIVVFKPPESDRPLIKRIVAIEGDRVEIKEGKVYVNGKIFLIGLPEEPETPAGNNPEYANLVIEPGYVYVLGDNRPFSFDSTEFGPIKKDWITGKAVFRFYPFTKFGKIN